jgi:S1-C subfamily serine protease
VVGVNSQIASDAGSAGGQPGSTGVGFAISSATVAAAVKEIDAGNGVSYGAAVRGALEAQRQARGGSERGYPYRPGPEAAEAAESAEAPNGERVLVP